MQNNQFKRLLRSKIEAVCKVNNLITVYVDISNNKRLFYVYTFDYQIRGQISMYLDNSKIHLCALRAKCNDTKNTISIANYDKEFEGSYLRLHHAIEFITDFVSECTTSVRKEFFK